MNTCSGVFDQSFSPRQREIQHLKLDLDTDQCLLALVYLMESERLKRKQKRRWGTWASPWAWVDIKILWARVPSLKISSRRKTGLGILFVGVQACGREMLSDYRLMKQRGTVKWLCVTLQKQI